MVKLSDSLRPAVLNDQGRIANLIYFETHVHRHLDWRSALDWLGAPEYWAIEQSGALSAVLACPPDPPGIAWIRLFAHAQNLTARQAWQPLWQTARERSIDPDGRLSAAITLQDWFTELLQESGFIPKQKIVVLEHHPSEKQQPAKNPHLFLRAMLAQDLPAVAALDAAAFQPLWQNSQTSLQMAFAQAGLATVIEENGELLGYQISTASPFGMHLARLAVYPEQQGRRIGQTLVQDLLRYASQQASGRITVNTQSDNPSSLALYQKLGFHLTGEQYPVYVLPSTR
ncbi:MAG: GNAT family N-acetyltransferase [Anaerolineales bacterium]|jgi:ribosomal protein S18 acetylase RimI-like enzyme|nr:GNAT family N-acetyltransferase [Anaerolineales bacterium]